VDPKRWEEVHPILTDEQKRIAIASEKALVENFDLLP